MKFTSTLFLTVLFIISLCAIPPLHSQENSKTPPREAPELTPSPPAGAAISGQAIIELRIKVRQHLTGMDLVLIPENCVEELKNLRNRRWLEKASRLKFDAGYFYLDLKSIGYFASQHAVSRTKTDAEGKYILKGIPRGRYRIYAQYKSRYAAGYWLIPVTVQSEKDLLTVDINNQNMEEIYNRELK